MAYVTYLCGISMPMIKPAIPKGTRDFSPTEVRKREFIFSTIRKIFHLYGFEPLETPSMENLATLTGKYGDEGDQLIFKILNSGDFAKNIPTENNPGSKEITPLIAEKALRYDLTVPFARYVVQHQNEITFPFRRYQIQPVWRADRPQKGRYREFYQCDADIIGSDSLINETELISLIDNVFNELDIPVAIKLNNRKILQGIADQAGIGEKFTEFTVAIDKLEKIGLEKVKSELLSKDIHEESIEKAFSFFEKDTDHSLKALSSKSENELLDKGIEELNYVISRLDLSANSKVEIDLTLARGLNYYTGTIIEIKSLAGDFTPTICAGGRYDDLTGIFGLKGMSGVGISFGADRIYDVMEATGKFPETGISSSRIMFVNFGEAESTYVLKIAANVRSAGISAEVYPDSAKMKKQMTYASQKQIPFVGIAGSEEIEKGGILLKNMSTGEQEFVTASELINKIR